MIFFNLLTMLSLFVWTPTPWWIIAIMFFCWSIMDLVVPTKKWTDFKIWRKPKLFK